MKQAKKLLAFLLVAVLVISLGSLTAFAADGDDPVDNPSGGNDAPAATGSITLNNATKGEEYKLYKVFDLTYGGVGEESNGSQANPANLYSPVAYTYTKKSGTDAFLTALQGDSSPFVLTQIGETGVYNIALKEGKTASDISTFLTAQKANLTPAVFTDKEGLDDNDCATAAGNISWSGLPYGYYYVTSSLGSAVTVDSTLPNVTIQDKNETVTVDKEVKEDSNAVNSKKNDADIGQVVEYTTTIHAVPNSTKLVLHDSMTEGLTFDETSVVVKVDGTTLTAGTNYELKVADPEDGDADGCTFEIDFAKYLSSITEKKDIVVTYKATLNEKAVIGLPQDNSGGNVNDTYVDYGAKNTTEHDSTTTYTWEFDLFKYYKESKDSTEKKALDGAKFSFKQGEKIVYLKKDATDTTNDKYIVVAVSANAPDGTEGTDWVKQITTTDKKVVIVGLDADTYTVTEDEAPAGYNKLTEPLTVKIEGLKAVTDDNGVTSNELNTDPASGTVYQTVKENGEDTNVLLADKTLEIENNKGTELPSTGGIGTTIFYVVGGLLLVGAGVLLVTKKRVGNDV